MQPGKRCVQGSMCAAVDFFDAADEADTSSLQPRHTVGVLSAVATAHPPTQLQRR